MRLLLGLLRRETPVAFPLSTGSLANFIIDGNLCGRVHCGELEAFVGVMLLIKSDWARPWLSGVLASDASLSCCGAAQGFWNPSIASERWEVDPKLCRGAISFAFESLMETCDG